MQILMIAGNIGKDAEVRTTGGGDKVAGFSVAIDNGKDRSGNKRDSTWVDCSLWGKRAESLAPYLRKGGKVTVTGRPTVREHNGKAYLGLSVDDITLQGTKSGGSGGGYGGQSGGYDSGSQGGYDSGPQDGGASRDLSDDIPF